MYHDLLLALNACLFDNPKQLHKLLSELDSFEAFQNKAIDLHRLYFPRSGSTFEHRFNTINLAQIKKEMENQNIVPVYIDTDDYPIQLKEIPYPAPVIFCKGNTHLLNKDYIAVVGARKNSSYGQQVTQSIIPKLCPHFGIVSGLALGIDAIAHHHCLKSNGQTIAVLATGLDIISPERNKSLGLEIIKKGLIVSEFPIGTAAKPHHFPQRNRIISGLSKGVLVIEAQEKSGALITARLAMETNRDLFAIPGPVYSELSQGPHSLIQDGAKLVQSAADILDEYGICDSPSLFQSKSMPQNLNEDEILLLQHISTNGTHIDELCQKTGLGIAKLTPTLSGLQLKDIIQNKGSNHYALMI